MEICQVGLLPVFCCCAKSFILSCLQIILFCYIQTFNILSIIWQNICHIYTVLHVINAGNDWLYFINLDLFVVYIVPSLKSHFTMEDDMFKSLKRSSLAAWQWWKMGLYAAMWEQCCSSFWCVLFLQVQALMGNLLRLRHEDSSIKCLVVSQFTRFLTILETPLR